MGTIPTVGEVAGYLGEIVPGASGSIALTLTLASSSGQIPCAVQIRVAATCTGCSYPERQIEFRYDFGDPSGTETTVCPVTGKTLDLNTDQTGHVAAYLYRTTGTKIITVRARLWTGSAWRTGEETIEFTASAFSGTEMWFDGVGGSDSNDGLSIGAPKQSWTAYKTFIEGGSNRCAYVKRGTTWTAANVITFPASTASRTIAYGSGDRPVITAPFSGSVYARTSGQLNSDILFSYIVIDSDDQANGINMGGPTAFTGCLIDNSEIRNAHDGAIGCNCLLGSRVVLWNSRFHVGAFDFVRHYWEMGDWFSVVGGTTGGGGTAPSHHFYVFKINYMSFFCHDFEAPADDSGRRNCIRYGCGDIDAPEGARNTTYLCFTRVFFRNHSVGLALSGTNGGVVTDGAITKIVVQLCDFATTNYGSGAGSMSVNNATELTVRDCTFTSADTSEAANIDCPSSANLVCDYRFYRNRVNSAHSNGDPMHHIPSKAGCSGLFEDNTYRLAGNGDFFFRFEFNQAASFTFRRNRYYNAGTNSNPFYNGSGPSTTNLAGWQGAAGSPDADAITTNPSWVDPAAGEFDAGQIALTDEEGVILSLDAGTYDNGEMDNGTAISRRIANIGTESLALSSGTLTGDAVSDEELPSFPATLHDRELLEASYELAGVGAVEADWSVSHDGVGSPFTATEQFDANDTAPPVVPRTYRIGGLSFRETL